MHKGGFERSAAYQAWSVLWGRTGGSCRTSTWFPSLETGRVLPCRLGSADGGLPDAKMDMKPVPVTTQSRHSARCKWPAQVAGMMVLTASVFAFADLTKSRVQGAVQMDQEVVLVQPVPLERYRFTSETLPPFLPCEQERMGMQPWKKLQSDAVTLCSGGASFIACLHWHLKAKAEPITFVCEFHNLVEVLSPNGTLRWVAQCSMHDVDRASLFRNLQAVHPLRFLEVRRELGDQELHYPLTVVEGLPADVDFTDHVMASLHWKSRKNATARTGLTFLSTGDCNTGNPGHCQAWLPSETFVQDRVLQSPKPLCQADQQNLFIVQNLLNKSFTRADTRVVLYSGFGLSGRLAENPGHRFSGSFSVRARDEGHPTPKTPTLQGYSAFSIVLESPA